MSYSFDEIDAIFFEDGYKLAKEVAGTNPDRDKLAAITKALYESIDTLIDSFTARVRIDGQNIDCRKGCSWCCSQPVFTNEWEAEYLRRLLKKRFTGDKIAELKTRASEKNKITSKLDKKKVLKTRIKCPFLENNICSVYPARPMACRIYLSSNLDSCIYEFNNPQDDKNYARLFDFPLHAGRKMNEGIAAWLEENGFNVKELRLEESII